MPRATHIYIVFAPVAATREAVADGPYRDLKVVAISRRADPSPATFYQYFKDVSDGMLQLADAAASEMPGVLAHIEGSWRGKRGLETARSVVRGFVDHWDAHRSVLLVRNLFADEGDRRFMKVRRLALSPVIEELGSKIRENHERGRIQSELHPAAAAAAMASILERLSAYHRVIEYFGAGREELIESCARILYQAVTGRSSP